METCYCCHMLRKHFWLSFNVLNRTWGGKSAGMAQHPRKCQSALNLIISVGFLCNQALISASPEL